MSLSKRFLLIFLGLILVASERGFGQSLEIQYDQLLPLTPEGNQDLLFNKKFDRRFDFVMGKIQAKYPDQLAAAESYLSFVNKESENPRHLALIELAPFLCAPRGDIEIGNYSFILDITIAPTKDIWTESQIPGLPTSISPCIKEVNGVEYVVTNTGNISGREIGFIGDDIDQFDVFTERRYSLNTSHRGGFPQYFAKLLTSSDQIDVKQWILYRMADFLLFHLDAGFRFPESSSSTVKFSFETTVAYFENRFLPLFYYAPTGVEKSPLFKKTFFQPNLITYDGRYKVAVNFPNLTLEGVVKEIADLGQGVAYDRSAFETLIGTFTYPWQILFHFDVNPRFLREYTELFGTAAFNDNWLIWANFIAGNGDEDTLRNSTYFRNQFKNLVIEGAIQ